MPLDVLVQSKRNKHAALKLMRKLLKRYAFAPERLVTTTCDHTKLIVYIERVGHESNFEFSNHEFFKTSNESSLFNFSSIFKSSRICCNWMTASLISFNLPARALSIAVLITNPKLNIRKGNKRAINIITHAHLGSNSATEFIFRSSEIADPHRCLRALEGV